MTRVSIPIGQAGDYEIKHLRIFKSVVECGGFSAAETELNISRSTISVHIANLESRLNLTLCHRGRAGFSLTEEGAVVYKAAIKLLGELEDFRNTINHHHSMMTGALKLVFSDSISLDPRACIPKAVEHFSTVASNVHLSMDVAKMTEIERIIMNKEADIGFIPYTRPLDGLRYQHMYNDVCYLYCSKGHPLFEREADALEDDLVNSFPAVHAGFKAHEKINEHLSDMNSKATAYNYEPRLALVLSSRFIGFLPERYAQPWVEKGMLKAICTSKRYYNLKIMAITKKTAEVNKVRDQFLRILQDVNWAPETSEAFS